MGAPRGYEKKRHREARLLPNHVKFVVYPKERLTALLDDLIV